MTETTVAPLILTLSLDEASQHWFDTLRQAHFPPERNYLAAHVTMFHHLPGEKLDAICDTLRDTALATAPFPLQVEPPWMMGRGVAYRLTSAYALTLRTGLAAGWADWLTPQDRQGWHPHVTVQNKVAPDVARALHAELQERFQPFAATATGLSLWHYRGGPWALAERWEFAEKNIN